MYNIFETDTFTHNTFKTFLSEYDRIKALSESSYTEKNKLKNAYTRIFGRQKEETIVLGIQALGNIKYVRDSSGNINLEKTFSPQEFVFRDSKWNLDAIRDLIRYFALPTGSIIEKKVYLSPFNAGNSAVLMAARTYKDIPYSAWFEPLKNNPAWCKSILGYKLGKAYEFIFTERPTDLEVLKYYANLSSDEKLKVRTAIHARKPNEERTNLFPVYIEDENFNKLNKDLKFMVTQSWCWHKDSRNKDMILDPINWDNVPEEIGINSLTNNFKRMEKDDFPF